MDNPFTFHVRTVIGLEEILAEELSSIGAQEIRKLNRLVTCRGDVRLLYQANVCCRTAIRVLLPLASFPAPTEKALYDGIRTIDWSNWLTPSGTLAVDSHVHSSFTTHSLFVSQLSKDAIVDQFRDKTNQRPSVDLERPDLRVAVSLFQNRAEIGVDTSGESLHKRGYRRKAGVAPLNEAVAAGLVRLSGWRGNGPLVDPMCGSGTIAIEAGLIALNIAPGLLRRRFGFQNWPDFNRKLYEDVVAEARRAIVKESSTPILGIEIDPEMIEIARSNVERAGLTGKVRIERADFLDWNGYFHNKGTLLMNPPYDERLSVDNVAELYQRIGERLSGHYAGWTAVLLAGNREALKYIGLKSSRSIVIHNGPIECCALKYNLSEGHRARSARAAPPLDPPRWKERAEVFTHRLKKMYRHYSKWARREGITCFRVYDRDIPELSFILDLYGDRLHFAELERNQDHSPVDHSRYIQLMLKTAAEALSIAPEKVYFKRRKPQNVGGFQYVPQGKTEELIEVTEGGHRFLINLTDYIDVGFFLDHRNTRKLIKKEGLGKDFLNLFAYTGSFTVFAGAGGAKSTMTVDTSRTYLEWAEKNLLLNGLSGPHHQLLRSDALQFLERTKATFDLCVVDPPTRSVNRSSGRSFEVQKDHVLLLQLVLRRMRQGGKIYFSTNFRTFEFDEQGVRKGHDLSVREISQLTLPLDFERKPSHRCWLIKVHDH